MGVWNPGVAYRLVCLLEEPWILNAWLCGARPRMLHNMRYKFNRFQKPMHMYTQVYT